jgi:hypothetical protein
VIRRAASILTPVALILTVACGGGGGDNKPAPDLSLSAGGAAIMQGQSGSAQVTANRLNQETGAITLTLSAPPAGITGSGTIASGATTGTFALQVAASVAPGSYPLTLSGTDGTLTRTASCALVVTALNTVAWRFDTTVPIALFAVQDGTGPWTPVTGTGGVYSFAFTQTKGAVAYIVDNTSLGTSDVVVNYGAASELGDRDLRTVPGDNLTATGTFTGLNATDTVDLYFGLEGYDREAGAGTGIWGMGYLNKGLHDLLAVQNNLAGIPQKVILHRDLDLEASGDLGANGKVDFSAEGAALTAGTLTVTGAGSNLIEGLQTLETDHGSAYLGNGGAMGAATMPLYALPAASLAASDRYSLAVSLGPDSGTGSISDANRHTAWTFTTAAPSVALPAPADLTLPTVSVTATAPYARLRTQWAFDAVYNQGFNAQFLQGTQHAWILTLTPGYGSADLTFPDFSALTGWKAAWGLNAGTAVTCTFTGYGRTWTTWPPVDGAQSNQAVRTTTVTP